MRTGLSVTRPSSDAIARFLTEQRTLDVSYADVCGTRTGATPPGFKYDAFRVDLGSGAEVFARASAGLRRWAAHEAARVEVTPHDAALVVGETVALLTRVGPAYMLASCRIVWTVDDDEAFGFGYGTLPGHPECGEESLVVRRLPDGRVVFELTAFSRARHPLARAAGPITRLFQVRAMRGYLRGMQRCVAVDRRVATKP